MKVPVLAGCIALAFAASAPAPAAKTTPTTSVDTQVASLDSASASRGEARVATRIASDFTQLAGSTDNALALVNALRTGTSVTLTSAATTGTGTTTTTFQPATGRMGWGNVFISLSLAQSQLSRLGIQDPTAADLQAALMGGSVTGADGTSTTLQGILQMRASGMGWGRIAQATGTQLGPVVSGIRSAHAQVAALPPTSPGTTAPASTAGPKSARVTTASARSGIVTAAGGTVASTAKGSNGLNGLSNASGHGNAASTQGIVTANGSVSSPPHMTAGGGHGAGLVTAAGGGANAAVTHGNANGNGAGELHGRGKGGG